MNKNSMNLLNQEYLFPAADAHVYCLTAAAINII